MKKKRHFKFEHDRDYNHMYLRQSVSYLLLHGHLKTTSKWAPKIARKLDKIISFAKKGDLAATRQIKKFLINHEYKSKKSLLFHVMQSISVRYEKRTSGFCSRTVIGRRKGDNSLVILLKLI